MNNLIEEFIKNLNTGNVWIGFLILGIFYILKKEPFKVFAHFNEQKNKDIELAKGLLESGKLSKESDELIKDYIENYTFKKYYGINANKQRRVAILKFFQKYQNEINWYDLKRAYPYFEPESNKVEIKLTLKNHIGRILVTLMSWFIGLYSFLIMTLAFLSRNENQTQFILFTFFALILLGGAMLFSSMNWPYHSAVKIKKLTESSNK